MKRPTCFAIAAAVLVISACTRVQIGQHVTAEGYDGSPQRMIVINALDNSFDASLSSGFANAIVASLAQCKVTALVYRPDSMELDAEAKFKAQFDQFKPDTVLRIRQTVRNAVNGEIRGGRYQLTLHDEVQRRDIWKAALGVGASTRWMADRSVVGPRFAEEVVRQMSDDHVLKGCPPFPPRPT